MNTIFVTNKVIILINYWQSIAAKRNYWFYIVNI